ncbi:Peptidyl-prolyl isomerase [Alternaria alternata]|nr:Peptidyl-prolyl isomerase [Alternaria alternata]
MGVCLAKSSISRSPVVVCRTTLAVGFGSRLYVVLILAAGARYPECAVVALVDGTRSRVEARVSKKLASES